MTATANAKNLWQYKITFSLITGQTLAFDSHPDMVSVVKRSVSMF